jgi:hypothetical protein
VTLNRAGKAKSVVSGVPKTISLFVKDAGNRGIVVQYGQIVLRFPQFVQWPKARQSIKRDNVIQITSRATPSLFF